MAYHFQQLSDGDVISPATVQNAFTWLSNEDTTATANGQKGPCLDASERIS